MKLNLKTGLKKCCECKDEKTSEKFNKSKNNSDKLDNICKECRNKRNRRRYLKAYCKKEKISKVKIIEKANQELSKYWSSL